VKQNEPGVLLIDAQNRGDTIWLRGPLTRGGHVQLGVQRLDALGQVIARDWVRVELPRSVPPGEGARMRVDLSDAVRGEAAAGVLIDFVAERRCWFAELRLSAASGRAKPVSRPVCSSIRERYDGGYADQRHFRHLRRYLQSPAVR
jgi:hypothetical protein